MRKHRGAVGVGGILPFQPFEDGAKLAVEHGVNLSTLVAGCENDALDKSAQCVGWTCLA